MPRKKRFPFASSDGPRPPDLAGMERAVGDFLKAAGFEPEEHPELAGTPHLVARAWAEEFLAGYRRNPAEVLAERMAIDPAEQGELVVLSDLRFVGVCPHHLLPYGGVAHVAYVPGRYLVGFGQIVQAIECLSRRFVLQEELAKQIASVLQERLEARGVAVALEAEQSCLGLRGERQKGSIVIVEAYAGSAGQQDDLRGRFRQALALRRP